LFARGVGYIAIAATCCVNGIPVSCGRAGLFPRLASFAVGVTHVAATACFLIATRPALLPASLLPFFAGAKLVGVGHTILPSNPFTGTFGW
jgi:hypothetical protein